MNTLPASWLAWRCPSVSPPPGASALPSSRANGSGAGADAGGIPPRRKAPVKRQADKREGRRECNLAASNLRPDEHRHPLAPRHDLVVMRGRLREQVDAGDLVLIPHQDAPDPFPDLEPHALVPPKGTLSVGEKIVLAF